MPTEVILPALGMAQETGKVVQWLKADGDHVTKGQPIVEVETDKAVVELEAPADGVLTGLAAEAGEDIPVGHVIARILAPDEVAHSSTNTSSQTHSLALNGTQSETRLAENHTSKPSTIPTSRLASRIAEDHKVDLNLVTPSGKRIQKADVLAYLQNQPAESRTEESNRIIKASPKARRLATEQGFSLTTIKGTGPDGAVLAADVLNATHTVPVQAPVEMVSVAHGTPTAHPLAASSESAHSMEMSTIWRLMAEHTTQSWTQVPHFFLMREVRARRLIAWREYVLQRSSEKVTYTDLLVKIVAEALRAHARLNATWNGNTVVLQDEINVGLAVAIEDGLVVPVIHHADKLSLTDIAKQRKILVKRAQEGKLRSQDLRDGTFTISNLGMYGIDTFNAIINTPQAAILAVGRMADRVVPVDGEPAVQPIMMLTLSCDHRVVDGARGAQFLATIAELIEEPLGLVG